MDSLPYLWDIGSTGELTEFLFSNFLLLLVLALGMEIPALGAFLKLDAQPRGAGRREMKNGEVDFFSLSLINSGSFAPWAFRLSAAPAISGSVNWGQGSGRALGNSWGQWGGGSTSQARLRLASCCPGPQALCCPL